MGSTEIYVSLIAVTQLDYFVIFKQVVREGCYC
jgi:hypothetical protein